MALPIACILGTYKIIEGILMAIKHNQYNCFQLKYSVICVSCAFLILGIGGNVAAKQVPFPSTPYYMKSTKIDRTTPNLVFLIDNSGSMNINDVVDPDTGLKDKRYVVARKVAKNVVKEFATEFRWGLAFLNAEGKYGEPNSIVGAGNYDYFNLPTSTKPVRSWSYYTVGGIQVPIDDYSTNHINNIVGNIDKMTQTGGTPLSLAARTVYNYMAGVDIRRYNQYGELEVGEQKNPLNVDYNFATNTDSQKVMQYRCQRNYLLILGDGDGDTGSMYSVDPKNVRSAVVPFSFAYNNDYRPEGFAGMPLDKEGKSWDDPYFPRQNIITHTIGLRAGSGALRKIANMSGGSFIMTNTGAELQDALRKTLTTMSIDVPEYVRYDQINYTNPMAFVDAKAGPNLVGVITINPDKWSSNFELRQPDPDSPTGFVQKDGQDIAINAISSHESGRNVLAVLPNRDKDGKVVAGSKMYNLSRSATTENLNNDFFSLNEIYKNDYPSEFVDVVDEVDIPRDTPKNALNKDRWKYGYIPWLTGWEDRADDSGTQTNSYPDYRNRASGQSNSVDNFPRHLGDIMRADVAFLGGQKEIAIPQLSSKSRFLLPTYVVLQSNDGMVRIYNAISTYSNRPYLERFAYIPGNALRENGRRFIEDLGIRAAKNYGEGVEREDFMSGSVSYYSTPSLHETKPNSKDPADQRLFFIGLLGQGGRAAYALNIGGYDDVYTKKGTGAYETYVYKPVGVRDGTTNFDKNLINTVPLWDTSTTAFGATGEIKDMGYTMGNAIVGMMAMERDTHAKPIIYSSTSNDTGFLYTTFLPNGYSYDRKINAKPAIYVLDTLAVKYKMTGKNQYADPESLNNGVAGRVLKKIEVSSAKEGATLGNVSAVDYNLDGIVDALYVGDSNGDVHRVDLREPGSLEDTQTTFKSYKIFEGTPGTNITAAPAIYQKGDGKIYVLFGNGRNYLEEDILTDKTDLAKLQTQTFYAIIDDITVEPTTTIATYANRDTNLVGQVLEEVEVRTKKGQIETVRTITSNFKKTDLDSKKGWYVDFKLANKPKTGERLVLKPSVVGDSVYFATETVSFRLPQDADRLMCVGASAESSSSIYQLHAPTGNALKAKGNTTSDLFLRFLQNGEPTYVASYYSTDSSVTAITPNYTKAVTNFGDALQNKQLVLPTVEGKKPIPCIEGTWIITGPNEAPSQVKCAVNPNLNLKRLSWSEIFN